MVAPPCNWIIDDTGFPKKGTGSVGVARQYCGHTGKTDNCRVAVSLSLGTQAGSLPLSYRLYLPHEWTEDPERCLAAGVPQAIAFATKNEIARTQIAAALQAGIARGTVLGGRGLWRRHGLARLVACAEPDLCARDKPRHQSVVGRTSTGSGAGRRQTRQNKKPSHARCATSANISAGFSQKTGATALSQRHLAPRHV